MGNHSYGRERLAAEAISADVVQVAEVGNLAGGEAFQRQQGILTGHAAAVVHHLQQTLSTRLQPHCDALGAGVQGVLQQFLEGAGGLLYHLAGSNAFGYAGWQTMHGGHKGSIA